jgi:hypothetical protein
MHDPGADRGHREALTSDGDKARLLGILLRPTIFFFICNGDFQGDIADDRVSVRNRLKFLFPRATGGEQGDYNTLPNADLDDGSITDDLPEISSSVLAAAELKNGKEQEKKEESAGQPRAQFILSWISMCLAVVSMSSIG